MAPIYNPAVVVLLRLLLAIFNSYRKPAIGLLDTGVVTMRVWPNDLDLNLHMNSGRYLSMMDVGRVALFAQTRTLDNLLTMNWRLLAGGAMVRYRKSLVLFDQFEVRSRLACWDEKWLYFEHVIEYEGEVQTTAWVRALLRDSDGNVPTSEFLAIAHDPDLESPPMPQAIARWFEAERA